ncbi:Hypothetical predicted protein [Olea europaea subsp. europaea]|uniref:Uncharacterized protein n=1 Tax=Olea europaea subsp. europaea TaxID=158383 RepID=A0A8S0U7V8_OLEEU|nr:Hypothetical predicted protein [Olea europaea subsp. europaea]
MTKQLHAHIQGMTTDGPIGTDFSFESYLDSSGDEEFSVIGIEVFSEIGSEAPECEFTRNCLKLLQEYEQAPSNSATEDDWLISIKNYVDDTTEKPQIQRIPTLLREKQSNKNCYDPLLFSIGPYHHGKKPQLEAFEKLKEPIAQKFVHACEVSIKQLHEAVEKMGENARESYEKVFTEEYDDESFNKMMFLDACFVLYFIIYAFLKTKRTNIKQKEADPLHGWICYLGFVRRDFLLLENQIPLLALKVLMKLLFKSEKPDWDTQLIQNFLDHKAIMPPQENSCNNAVKKFLAQMMRCSVQKKEKSKLDMDELHLLHLVWKQLIGSSPEDKNKKKSVKRLRHPDREQLIGSFPEDKNSEKFPK